MPIMSDKWIRQKAENEQLIVPFHAESRSNNEDGTPVTSYGLSSFGYDIRLGNIFRLFNHRNSNNLNVDIGSVRDAVSPDVIDPVNFNEAHTTRYDLLDDECITIPPHGFMLGVSKERIKLGNEFTAICMEKSTLARCFTGDTKIALVDGTAPTFLEAIERVKKGEKLFGYSVDDDGCIAVAELVEPRKIGTEEVLTVVLDNGDEIECTPDHAFMQSNGKYIEAQDMVPGTSVMPLYRTINRGYEAVFQPRDTYITSTHWLADEYNVRSGKYGEHDNKCHRHHVDHNKRNNKPDNVIRMSPEEHKKHHDDINLSRPEYREMLSLAQKESWKKRAEEDKEFVSKWKEQSSKAANTFWYDDKHFATRQKWLSLNKEHQANRSPEQRREASDRLREYNLTVSFEQRSERRKRYWETVSDDNPERHRLALLKKRDDVTADTLENALKTTGSLRAAARFLNVDRSAFRRFPDLIRKYKELWDDKRIKVEDIAKAVSENLSIRDISEKLGVSRSYIQRRIKEAKEVLKLNFDNNHKVVEIKREKKIKDVYCLTAPEFGNFALEAGVFVKNCGLCVTVTPLEAGWEGYVTLELSNKTDLPIKLTPGMGICQVLFLHGNEPCEISYADRNGKYQDQPPEPVLPRRKM